MKNSKGKTVILDSTNIDYIKSFIKEEKEQIELILKSEIIRLSHIGYNIFVVGLVDMFDLILFETIIEFRRTNSNIVVCVIIYEGQLCLSPQLSHVGTKDRFRNAVVLANHSYYISKKQHLDIFQKVNNNFKNIVSESSAYNNPYGYGVLYVFANDNMKEVNESIYAYVNNK